MQTRILSTISTPLYYEGPLVAMATDDQGRRYVGSAFGDGDLPSFIFTQVDRVTEREFLGGKVDLLEIMTERCAGDRLRCDGFDSSDLRVACTLIKVVPPEALPGPGLLMPQDAEPDSDSDACKAAPGKGRSTRRVSP